MAAAKIIKRDSFKRGDTVCFQYLFQPPFAGYDWTQVRVNCALTAQTAPNDNTLAAAVRTNQSLTINTDASAYFLFQLTHAESAALTVGTTYTDECQMIENSTNYLTPIQGQSTVAQDFYI